MLKRITKLILEAITGEFRGNALSTWLIHHLQIAEGLCWQVAVLNLITLQRRLTTLLLMVLQFRSQLGLNGKCHFRA